MAKVICEPAIYWHGDVGLLNEYIEKAAACGASFFKLQLFHPNRIGPHDKWIKRKQFFENNFIDDSTLSRLQAWIGKYGMELVCTVNDRVAVERAYQVTGNVKIASGQLEDLLIQRITDFKWDRVFVSTGMFAPDKIDVYMDLIHGLGDCADEVIIMHCRSLYPTEYSECDLSRIEWFKYYLKARDIKKYTVGYSDHCYDTLPCMMALGMGVPYIEKHFRIEGAFGPTIECAADEEEFAELCACASQQEKIMGRNTVEMHPRERASIEHYQGRFIV